MKSKAEILDSYYAQGADGMPEIAADGLLKAMDEYAEQAFNAARADNNFLTFVDYKKSLEKVIKPEQHLRTTIQLISDTVLPQFLPHNPEANSASFDIKTNGIIYNVFYSKDAQGYWEFQNYSQYT